MSYYDKFPKRTARELKLLSIADTKYLFLSKRVDDERGQTYRKPTAPSERSSTEANKGP